MSPHLSPLNIKGDIVMINIRKNLNQLSPVEKSKLVSAFLKLKYYPSPISGRTYDTYVRWHLETMFFALYPGGFYSYAHGIPGFLPWHRQYLRLLELDLQAVADDDSLMIPYWDWTTDGADSSMWSNDFLGPNGDAANNGIVPSGPFSYQANRWSLNIRDEGEAGLELRRAFGQGVELPKVEAVRQGLDITPFDVSPWNARVDTAQSFRSYLERVLHNVGHRWIGGSMLSMTSPNDPVFFLHHCNVDRLWAKWQDAHLELSYLPLLPIPGVPGSGIDEIMPPFGVNVRSVLDHWVLGYGYDGKAADDAPLAGLAPEVMMAPMNGDIGDWRKNPFQF